MYYCKELNKQFKNKAEIAKALRNNYKDIIAEKRAKIYNSEPNGTEKCSIKLRAISPNKLLNQVKNIEIDDTYYYVVVNTTKILDGHKDLHLNGIWNKTIKEQQGKVYLVLDHKLGVTTTVVRKEYIEMFVAEIPFSILGQPYEGLTEALIYKFRKDRVINDIAKEWLDSGDEIQASVRMQYMKILFAFDSEEKEDKEFKRNYDLYINQIANKDEFVNGIIYFWPVVEAANKFESSLVLFGSNHSTGIITESNKLDQPPTSTDGKIEPSKEDTQKQFYLNLLKNN